MNQIQRPIKRNIDINSSHLDVLEKLFKKVNQIIKGKRDVMYSDIINIIARKNYSGKLYNEIILWCNYNIRQGKYFAIIPDFFI